MGRKLAKSTFTYNPDLPDGQSVKTGTLLSSRYDRRWNQRLYTEERKAKTRKRYNQVPYLTGTPYGKVTKTRGNITHKRAKRSALSLQVRTRL